VEAVVSEIEFGTAAIELKAAAGVLRGMVLRQL
jgi:hypothetical protein